MDKRFRRLMRPEVLLAVAVLGVTGVLTQLPSPRSALPSVPQKDRTVTQTLALDDLRADLRVRPNLVGVNQYRIALREAEGGPPADAVRQVRFRFRYQDPAVGPVTVSAAPAGANVWTLEGAFFGLEGGWTRCATP